MDATWLWQSDKLSDVRIRLVCMAKELDPETRLAKRPCTRSSCEPSAAAVTSQEVSGCLELPAHSTILGSLSGYWQARVLRWTASELETASAAGLTTSQPTMLEETVDDSDQLYAAINVLCYGYTKQLDECASIAMLVQMAVIADKWDMLEVVSACWQKASDDASSTQLSVEQLNTLLDSSLPETVRTAAAYKTMQQACAAQLLTLFGSASDVVTSPSILQSFCSLSLGAVQLWAGQDELLVDSENTVAVLFTHWWEHHKGSFSEQQSSEAARTLTETLRAWDCSHGFICCVLDQLPWFRPSQQAVHVLRLLHNIEDNPSADKLMPEAWVGTQHSISPQCLTLPWAVTRAELDQLHQQAAQGKASLMSTPMYWRGITWQVSLELASQRSPLALAIRYSVVLPASFKYVNPAVLFANGRLTVETDKGVVAKDKFVYGRHNCLEYGRCCPRDGLLQVRHSELPRAHSHPPDALWHPDGKLHLSLIVHSMP